MGNRTPIIIIGFGSIGQRHWRNLRILGYENLWVYDPDKKKTQNLSVRAVNQLNPACLKKFQVALICTPPHLHIRQALLCARAGCHLFIEKPLSHNLAGLKLLQAECKKRQINVMVAANMRFHPCLQFIKRYLEQKRLGRIYAIHHEFGYFLPYWRPDRDYRKNYAAKRAWGGGIVLDDIHEFDLLFWLFGSRRPTSAFMQASRTGRLAIDGEDVCAAAFRFADGSLGTVRCDYLQKKYSRNCKVVGEKGNLEWTYGENQVWLKNEKGVRKLFEVKSYDANLMYLEELRHFFQCLATGVPNFNGLPEAAAITNNIIHLKKYGTLKRISI